jgi:signal transduction histidine kinase
MVGAKLAISLVELCFGLGAALVAYFAWQSREKPAGFPVFVLTATGCAYAVTTGLESLTTSAFPTWMFGHLRWPFGSIIAVATFYTAVEYTNRTQLQRPAIFTVLTVFVAVDFVGFLTNPVHERLLTDVAVENGLFVASDGPLLWVHLVTWFGVAGVGLGLLLLAFNNRGVYRTQTAAIIAGIGIAFGFFVVEAVIVVHPAFNVATLGIVLGSSVLLWAITRAGLLETVPVAREMLVDNMEDSVIALDADNHVIDINESARELLAHDGKIFGRPAGEVFEAYPELIEQFGGTLEAETEFTRQQNGERRHYHLSISPLTQASGTSFVTESEPGRTRDNTVVGRLIVVSDITDQRRREQELDLLKEVFARVLRHNIRNDLNVIKGNASVVAERAPESVAENAEIVADCTDDLLSMSEKARDLEAIIESPRTRMRVDLESAIDRAVDEVAEQYPEAHISTDIYRPCAVLAHQELETALKNLAENACEHDTDPPTTVEITTSVDENTVEMVIADDGPGISDHELDVLAAESETRLQHGSGLGLWIINWVVNRSDAALDVEADGSGTCVTLTFERASVETENPQHEPDESTELTHD